MKIEMKNYFLGKKGEITTNQIVLLIILIVSFAVLIFFLSSLGLDETSESQICHNSVVMQSKASDLSGGLDCKTTYVCISGGEDCDSSSRKKINVDAQDKTEIFNQIAILMSDCWWMFGEGNVDYITWKFVDKKHCAICSSIKFDNTIKKTYSEGIAFEQFYNFLGQENLPGKEEKYLSYLYGVDVIDDLPEVYKSGIINFTKEYSLITGIDKDKSENERSMPILVKTLDEVHNQNLCDVFDITKG